MSKHVQTLQQLWSKSERASYDLRLERYSWFIKTLQIMQKYEVQQEEKK